MSSSNPYPDPAVPSGPTRWGAPVGQVTPPDGASTWGRGDGPVPPPVAARGPGDGPRLVDVRPVPSDDGPDPAA